MAKNHIHHHHKGSQDGGVYSFLGKASGMGVLVGLFGGGWALFWAPLGVIAAVKGIEYLLGDGKTVTHHHYHRR